MANYTSCADIHGLGPLCSKSSDSTDVVPVRLKLVKGSMGGELLEAELYLPCLKVETGA